MHNGSPVQQPPAQKEKVRAFFDANSAWQGGYYSDADDYFSRIIRRRKEYAIAMLRNADPSPSGKALDIGCGSGVYLGELYALGYDVTGVDMSREMLASCRRNLSFNGVDPDSVRLLPGDVEHLPLPDGEFDLVICIGVFGYLPSDEQALYEIRRVLKPGGRFLLNLTNAYSLSDIDFVFRRKVKTLFVDNDPLLKSPDYAIQSPWMLKNRHYMFKSYNPWLFENVLGSFGFKKIDAMTYGFEFRLLRRFRLLPARWLDRIELAIEGMIRRHSIPYISYSGWVYTGVFEKR